MIDGLAEIQDVASQRGTDHILRREYRLVIAAASRYLSAR